MEDNKIIELLTHILESNKEMVNQIKNTNIFLDIIHTSIGNMEREEFYIRENSIKTNLKLQEMNQSLHQINKKMAHFAEHENRIRKLEQICKIP